MEQEYPRLLRSLRAGNGAVLVSRWQGGEGPMEGGLRAELCGPEAPGDLAGEALRAGLPVLRAEGGEFALAEPFFPEERLIVLGGGHVALPLVEFAAKTGFKVTVADDRLDFANAGRFPSAGRVICDSFENALERLRVTGGDYVAILTRGHRYDQVCLEKLLAGPEPFYTGMIGSHRRVALVMEQLARKGCDEARLRRVHSPIGLPIGSVTPEEIAVSILAEMIACKRAGGESARAVSRSDIDFEVLEALASGRREPVCIATIIASKGSTPRGPGAKMLVYPDGRLLGSIGGGCSEAEVIGNARRLIGSGKYRMQTVDLTGETAEDDGMVCGGILQVLLEDSFA